MDLALPCIRVDFLISGKARKTFDLNEFTKLIGITPTQTRTIDTVGIINTL